MASDEEKIAELTALVEAVRSRVSARYPSPGADAMGTGARAAIHAPVVDLMPLVHARDAAQAKIAAIGGVNPRPGGLVNGLIQKAKKSVARALGWFVRDQIVFNREMVSALEATLEALNDQNRALQVLASQANEQFRADAARGEALRAEATELKDIRAHWTQWREAWERRLRDTEVELLRALAALPGGFQHRLDDAVKAHHAEYLAALTRTTLDIQDRLWADIERAMRDFERLIYTELRVIRQKTMASSAAAITEAAPKAGPAGVTGLDYERFAEQFRGTEEYVRQGLEIYKPFFTGLERVLDIGCGRGEFLEVMREMGCAAVGIDLSEESAALCRAKGLRAEVADLFAYLAAQPEGAFDGIFCAQVVEHIEPERLPEMIRLCATRLRPDGVLAIETPNPECLAIFATHFYLDPTHVRPVPHPLLAFYMHEAGFGTVEVRMLSPALESIPELGELPEGFRRKFFGGLDYAITGRRL